MDQTKEIQEPHAPTDLQDELKDLFDPSFSTLGHGTSKEAAEQILEEGLRVRFPDLQTTAMPLFDGSKSFDEQAANVMDIINNWPHHNLKSIVAIMIPNPEKNEDGGLGYFNSIVRELPEEDTGYNARHLIPRSYIRGYIDAESKKFVSNPHFNPTKPTVERPQQAIPPIHATKDSSPRPVVTLSNSTGEEGQDVW